MEKIDIMEEDFKYCASKSFMQYFKGKTILIYGASGMIGGYLCEVFRIMHRMYGIPLHVVGVSRNNQINRKKYEDDRDIFHFKDMDVCNLSDQIPHYDIAIFAAGKTDHKICNLMPDEIYTVNTIGLHNALKDARDRKCEVFLYLSSASVYGDIGSGILSEDMIGACQFSHPDQVYAQSKRMGECICNCFSKQYGIDVRIVRPFHMYGPGMDIANSGLVYESIRRGMQGETITLRSVGTQKRNFSYMRDIILQIFLVIARKSDDRTFNLGTKGNTLAVKEWMEKLENYFGVEIEQQSVDFMTLKNDYDVVPDLERIEALEAECEDGIGVMSIEEGIKRTADFLLSVTC